MIGAKNVRRVLLAGRETMIGVIKPDRKGLLFVDEDRYFGGTLRSDNEMELCLQETTGQSMIATCYFLTRK